jgi:YggT family protein
MFLVANLLIAVAQVLDYILWAYMWIVIARVIISWVNADPSNPLVRFIYAATEPVLERVRRALPVYAGGFDLSPIVVWIAVLFLQHFVVRSLFDLAYALR